MEIQGEFEKRGDYIFRTQAFLQWGESEKIIGSVILFNPGKAKLESKQWNDLNSGIITRAKGKITRDLGRIYQIEKVIKKIYPCPSGRLLIYNLFNIVESNPNTAIDIFNNIKDNPYYREVLYPDISLLHEVPWIWLAWTTKDEQIEELVERIEPQLIALPHKRIIGDPVGDPHWKLGYCIGMKYPPIKNKDINELAAILKEQIEELKKYQYK